MQRTAQERVGPTIRQSKAVALGRRCLASLREEWWEEESSYSWPQAAKHLSKPGRRKEGPKDRIAGLLG